MSTTTTWPGGTTDASPTAYSIPASGELNWAALSDFLNVLATSAQSTTAQKWGMRKALTSPVTVSATADCAVVTQLTSPGAVTVNLPAGANKQVFCIVDGTGDAATNNVTINRNGSDTIAGATSLVLASNREAVVLCYNSSDTDWKIVARTGSPAALASGKIFVGNSSGVATAVTPTGDVTITNTGVTAIASGVIVDADINASAAITGSKIVSATASVAGVVDIATQSFAGIKSFTSQPAFRATGGTNNLLATGTTIAWTEDFDTGSNFASNTFTAPVAGKYLFNVVVNHTGGGTAVIGDSPGVQVKQNSTGMAVFTWSAVGANREAGGSTILNLVANDTVVIVFLVGNGTTMSFDTGQFTVFTGCKIA